jgi:rod shape-determining protein MreB
MKTRRAVTSIVPKSWKLPFFLNPFSYFVLELAIDLGTANTRIHLKGKGIVLQEPTVIAQQQKTNMIMAVGHQAEQMMGRAPKNITISRPLAHGVISDFDMTQALLAFLFDKLRRAPGQVPLPKFPRVLIGIPAGVTEVERKAVIDAGLAAGARRVFIVEEPIAAAIGAGLPISKATASMILDIGAGTSEIAIVSGGGIVTSRSLPVAGDELDDAIVNWIRESKNVLTGHKTAEELKRQMSLNRDIEGELPVRGRDLTTGLPREISINKSELVEALKHPLEQIIDMVREIIEETPPELVADLVPTGLVLSGGGSLLHGLDQYLADVLHIPVRVAENPELAVIKGLALILEDTSLLESLQIPWGS